MRSISAVWCLFVVAIPVTMSLAAGPDAVPLRKAIEDFNDRAADSAIGKEQPPLSEEEVIIRERWIRSRLVGEEERKVIREHQKRVKERGGSIMFDEEGEYWREREKAAERDHSKQK